MGHGTGQHLTGELGDGVASDESTSTAGDPHGVRMEEGDELLDELVLLGVLEGGTTSTSGQRSRCRCRQCS